MSKTTLYKQARTGKIQQWTIWVEEKGKSGYPEVWIEHGLTDGKKQETYDVITEGVNIGKANETTALEQANLILERKVTKQTEEGYRPTTEEATAEKSIDFEEPLPKELCFYKPKNSIDDKKIAALEKLGIAAFTVKRDGMMHVVRKTKRFGVEIYSRRMDLVTEKYPHIKEAFQSLPDDTLLLGEIVLLNGDKDNFNGVSQICRSDPPKAIERQDELGKVSYYIFDVAFHGGSNWLTQKVWLTRWTEAKNIADTCGSDYVLAAEKIDKSHTEAMKEVKKRGLEGLVVWDASSIMKEKESFTFNGKAYRPNVLWKSKPKYEDDFVVKFDPDNGIGEYGSGKNNGKVKSVFIYQLLEGEEVFLGKCGGGLSDEQRDFYTTASYPRVWRIEYDSVQPKTGSLRFPVFNADRTLTEDKSIEECVMSDAIKQARTQENEEDE